MAKNVAMDDIAAELNISKSLVSRALSDKYGVSDEMRNRIKTTAVRMGYKFKTRAKSTFTKTESITIVVERHDLLDSGFWVKIINGIEKKLYSKNISVFLSVIENDEEDFMPLSIKQMKTNGILVLGKIPFKHVVSVSTTGLPIVLVDSPYFTLKFDHILANNYYGAYEATELILDNGHKSLGFVGSTAYSYSFKERFRGFTDCIKDKDFKIGIYNITDDFDEFYVPFSKEQFKKVMTSKNRPTALLCANDITAFLVYEILDELGMKVYDDVSVVGFDNVPKCEWVAPALTSVNIPKTSIGERAVDLLLERIENPDRNPELVMIGTDIVERNSLLNLNSKKQYEKS